MVEVLNKKDYSQIPKVYADGFMDTPWETDWYQIPEFNAETVWVYKEKGEVVGFIISFLSNDNPYISVLTVKQKFQQRGIARKLLNHALEYWKAYDYIYIHVDHERKEAFELYKSVGFEIKELRKDDYYMKRELI